MADAAERQAWYRCYRAVEATAASGLSPRRVQPGDVIPERYLPAEYRPDPKRDANRERVENDLAWAALGAGLQAGVRE